MPAFGQFFQWQFTIDGLPLTDGKLFHYIAGTSTDKNIWAERDRTTPVAQPLESNGDGIFSGYGDGLYKFVLTESDGTTVIVTWDNVSIVANDARGVGAAVASSTELILGDDGDVFHVTGTETIETIVGNQSLVTLVFDDVLTLTHSSQLLLNGSVNFLTASGSVKQFINEGSGGVWREVASPLDTLVGDVKIKKDTPLVRFKSTVGSGTEYAAGENSGNWAVWINTNTEASPVWSGRISYTNATTLWTLTGHVTITGNVNSPTLVTPTIASFVNATHTHLAGSSGGLLGTNSVGTTQIKVTAGSHTSGSITDNVGGTSTFSVTGMRISGFVINPSTATGGTCHLDQIHANNDTSAAETWKLTVDNDGTGGGTTTYTITWSILGTVS